MICWWSLWILSVLFKFVFCLNKDSVYALSSIQPRLEWYIIFLYFKNRISFFQSHKVLYSMMKLKSWKILRPKIQIENHQHLSCSLIYFDILLPRAQYISQLVKVAYTIRNHVFIISIKLIHQVIVWVIFTISFLEQHKIICFIHSSFCIHFHCHTMFSDSVKSKWSFTCGIDWVVSVQNHIISSLWAVVEHWKWKGITSPTVVLLVIIVIGSDNITKELPISGNF